MSNKAVLSLVRSAEWQVQNRLQILTKVGWSLEINVMINDSSPYSMLIQVKGIMVRNRIRGWGKFDYEHTIKLHQPEISTLDMLAISDWCDRLVKKANSHVRWDEQPRN